MIRVYLQSWTYDRAMSTQQLRAKLLKSPPSAAMPNLGSPHCTLEAQSLAWWHDVRARINAVLAAAVAEGVSGLVLGCLALI